MPKVSIVIPAYNEEAFIGTLLETILQVDLKSIGFEREIIVVDNGSKDRTHEIASAFQEVRCLHLDVNQGKGGGVKYGVANATGDYILIQDADLEYNPKDYIPLLKPLSKSPQSLSVYGSRILGELQEGGASWLPGKHKDKSLATYIANTILSLWAFLLYGRYMTDTLTGYKVYPAKLLQNFSIQTFGFETDHELTAKLLRSGVKIIEVPVSYQPRTLEEGKKIRAIDFVIALWTFLKFRFVFKKNF
jgi:glycosyltransferase involved in cell wall biosynthesis